MVVHFTFFFYLDDDETFYLGRRQGGGFFLERVYAYLILHSLYIISFFFLLL